MSVQELYKSEEISVFFLPGGDDLLLITFAAIDFDTKKDAFWGRYFAEKAGFSALGFVTHRNNWYPQKYMSAARKAIESVLVRYAMRITYGSSMGAYGAVKYSNLLGAKACVAFGPQHTIDPADSTAPKAHQFYFDPVLHADMRISASDVCARPYIFFDPKDPIDVICVSAIADVAPQANLVKIPYAGHECIKILDSTVSAKALIEECAKGNTDKISDICRTLRLKSSSRYAGLAEALLLRRPELALRIIKKYGDRFDPKQLGSFHEKLAGHYMEMGDLLNAEINALRATEVLPNRSSFVRRLAQVYDKMGIFDKALICYRRYLELNPVDFVVHSVIAGMYLDLGNLDEAGMAADKVLALSRTHAGSLRRVSKVRVAQGRLSEAILLLRESLALEPNNSLICLELSKALHSDGQPEEALQSARQALQLNPQHKQIMAQVIALNEGRGC